MPKGVYERKPWTERFWSFVDKNGPIPPHRPNLGKCWIWTGSTVRGYGQFWRSNKQLKAHRVAYELKHGPVPDGVQILHHCDNRRCVRASHHFLGDHDANMSDRDTKLRQAHGVRNAASKGTPAKIRKITQLYLSGKYTQEELGRMFGRTQVSISQIIRGVTWRHLKRPFVRGVAVRGKKKRT